MAPLKRRPYALCEHTPSPHEPIEFEFALFERPSDEEKADARLALDDAKRAARYSDRDRVTGRFCEPETAERAGHARRDE